MTDEEFVYRSDLRDKKTTAHSAAKRVNGSGSKMCRLPHDGMTRKEWEKMNGQIKTLALNKPATLEQLLYFLETDSKNGKEIVCKYLDSIQSYRVRRDNLLGMLQCSREDFESFQDLCGYKFKFAYGMIGIEDAKRWNKMLIDGHWATGLMNVAELKKHLDKVSENLKKPSVQATVETVENTAAIEDSTAEEEPEETKTDEQPRRGKKSFYDIYTTGTKNMDKKPVIPDELQLKPLAPAPNPYTRKLVCEDLTDKAIIDELIDHHLRYGKRMIIRIEVI